MDLGLSDRRALVTHADGPIGATCARALRAEGVHVLDAAGWDGAAPVDIVVADATGMGGSTLLDVSSVGQLDDAWTTVVDAVDLYRRVVPGMAERRWGRLVWVGTAASRSLDADDDEIGAIVTLAMRAVGKVVAAEAGPTNVTANAVLHGGQVGPDDVASAVCFLCSEGAGYLTGVSVTVDGGAAAAVH